jgi:uncharacterized protein YqeY
MLMELIRTDLNDARRQAQRDRQSLLITLYAEAQAVGKNRRNGDTTDDEAVAVVRKFAANLEDTVRLLRERNQPVTAQMRELEILNKYLPQQLDQSELVAVVEQIVRDNNFQGAQSMGSVMAALKSGYSGRYDGRQAAAVVRQVLSGG